jgi:hypothetical protein
MEKIMFDQTGVKIGTSLYYVESFPERMPPEKPSVVQELIVTKVGKKYIYFGEKRRLCKGEGSIKAPWSASKWQSWKWLSHCYSCKLEAQLNCNKNNLVRGIDTALVSKNLRMIDDKFTDKLSFGTLETILAELTAGEIK